MSYRAKITELVEKLQLQLPIEITLEDPISLQEFTVRRENVLSLLMFNPEALVVESQTVAALYAEMARLQRAAEYKRDRLETKFTRWKAKSAIEFRKVKDEATGKYPSEEKVKEMYRNTKDYRVRAEDVSRYTAIAGLFEDLKWAFQKKGTHIEAVMRSVGGYESTERTSDVASSSSPEDEDRLEELAGSIYRASSIELEKDMKHFWGTEEEPSEEEEDDEDPGLEEEEEDDEADPDDPPPPTDPKPSGPKKKSRKKKRGAKKKARRSSRRGEES